MTDKRTELQELGEFGLIGKISDGATIRNKSTIKGIGDDAAVIVPTGNLVVSSDILVEGIHFDLSYYPLKHLGYKAVVINVSDIAAMGAIPSQVVVNIALSNRFSLEAVEIIYEGIHAACQKYNVDLVGGDTSASASGLVISATAIGMDNNKPLSYRSGAKKGDILCATGDLGAAYIGLQVLEREKQVFLSNPEMQPDLEKYNYIVERQLKPEARMDIVHELSDMGIVPSSMIDISDGLASETLHLAKNSDVDFRIYEDKLPIDKMTFDTAVEFNLDPITCVLNGGEDYELLFTIEQDTYEKIKNHQDIHFIGYALEKGEGSHLVTKNQNMVPLKAQGWNHFS